MERSYDAGASAGARIRMLRTERGLSLSALAAAAEIGKGTLSELEAGRRNPTLETLYAVAGPLGVPLAALLEDHDGAGAADEALSARRLHLVREAGHTTEVYLVQVAPGRTRRSPAHATGAHEQLVVLTGRCRLDVGGTVVELGPGEHHAWAADVAHAYTGGPEGFSGVDVIRTPG
ncbi:hypothetical transcriptional regulator [Nocardioides sp. OK12]|uniref:Transcriptional regulator with XRE-family HTH domain n=1 Tax=Nocardioides marinisabuli TaxID=419476 RepID=A0A7Y9EY27_9ACTN|nr:MULTISPECIES: helix-turn-helix domain-containing protein [Nocardioides]NYD56042.1 transcriptional regulator with XRE-family HTH domain [Nocardioides marinisabuli]GHJ61372.1 hypothetical transcriptional regulator [Nocardioides sp. OK12]